MESAKHSSRISICLIVITLFSDCIVTSMHFADFEKARYLTELEYHREVVFKYYDQRRSWKTSNFGAVLFKNGDPELFMKPTRLERTFTILLWKFTTALQTRHLQDFLNTTKRKRTSILKHCRVNNCIFTDSDQQFSTADAVVIPMHNGLFPRLGGRNLRQRWIFMFDESPMHKLILSLHSRNFQLKRREITNLFNWTMTYRSDSDIPIPFGRTIPLARPLKIMFQDPEDILKTLVPFWSEKQFVVLVAVFADQCNDGKRTRYLKQLKKHIKVDLFGGCPSGHLSEKCPLFTSRGDPNLMKEYLFHIVMESSSCRQYISDKVFFRAFIGGAIPIIMGTPLEDCIKLLPPNSFLYVGNYRSPEYLAKHVMEIAGDPEKILDLHMWRKHFNVTNEHGLHGTKSSMLCSVCEAMNYNDGETFSYDFDNIMLFFNERLLCDMSYS